MGISEVPQIYILKLHCFYIFDQSVLCKEKTIIGEPLSLFLYFSATQQNNHQFYLYHNFTRPLLYINPDL